MISAFVSPLLHTSHTKFTIPLTLKTTRRPPARRPRPRTRTSPSLTPFATIDYYTVLDVPQTADSATIKRAYRRAALKNHPDVSNEPNARERFIRIQQAYTILSDPSKRTSYDRQRSTSSAFNSFANGFGFDFNSRRSEPRSADAARKWKQENPMPNDLNDNFSTIFSDLFSDVSSAVKSNGLVDDFVDFLENRVDGSPATNDDNALKDVLNSSNTDVLEAEIEDAKFVLRQLRSRKERAQSEQEAIKERAIDWKNRADRAYKKREYQVRDSSTERQQALLKEAARFGDRVTKTESLLRNQEQRLSKIEARLQYVRNQSNESAAPSKKSYTSSASTSTPSSTAADSGSINRRKTSVETRNMAQKAAIDDEMEKMKRELGL